MFNAQFSNNRTPFPQHMPQRYHRMPPHHAGAGPAHHLPHLLALFAAETVHGAVGAVGFVGFETALIYTHKSKGLQLAAAGAKPLRMMMLAAVHAYHQADHFFFSFYAVHNSKNVKPYCAIIFAGALTSNFLWES